MDKGYMPRIGERFRWCGCVFERIEGPLVEQSLHDGQRSEIKFPVRYLEAENNPELVGALGLMEIMDLPDATWVAPSEGSKQ